MKSGWIVFAALLLCLPVDAQVRNAGRKSLLDSDPEVVYMAQAVEQPVKLKVIKEAPVFSDKSGNHRLGTLKADQTVELEAITDKIYRVRGQGTHDGIAGWVAPWAFSSKDPQFVVHLKELYDRQIQVQALIANNQVAVGMTLDEVSLAKGKPTKTTVRKTEKGQSGSWDFVEYDEEKHYITRLDPITGAAYRQFSHVTQIEKSRLTIEFEDNVVTALVESEDRKEGNIRIVVPPLFFGW